MADLRLIMAHDSLSVQPGAESIEQLLAAQGLFRDGRDDDRVALGVPCLTCACATLDSPPGLAGTGRMSVARFRDSSKHD